MYGDDDTHITGQITFEQIAEAIRHKKYGRDMREAIAQGFEQFIGLLGRVSNLESEYSDLLGKYNDIIDRLNDDENEIHNLQGDVKALNQRCDKIEEKHNDDIKALNEKHNDDIEATNQRLTKLEKAVFEAQYINDTKSDVEAKPSITHEINDTHVVNDDNGIIIQDEHQTLPNDVN